MTPLAVIKVGGSLYDLPDLGPRLSNYVATLTQFVPLIVPGGGAMANVVRHWDATHHLGEDASHWLALQALAINARFLARLVRDSILVDDVDAVRQHWLDGKIRILNAHRFCRSDEERADHLPHHWNVTSDSVAARVAIVAEAARLILLKSTSITEAPDWAAASRRGLVDPMFPTIVAGGKFTVEVVDFRHR